VPPEKAPNWWDHERRLKALETRVSTAQEHIRELSKANRTREEFDSQAGLSVHPGGLRMNLKGLPAWVFVAIFAIVSLLLFSIFGSIKGNHAPLPEAAGGFVPATE
jgi:hypothetical protein